MLSCCVPSLRLNDFPIFFLNINFPTGPGLILDFLANGFVPVLSAKKEPYQLVASSSHSLSSLWSSPLLWSSSLLPSSSFLHSFTYSRTQNLATGEHKVGTRSVGRHPKVGERAIGSTRQRCNDSFPCTISVLWLASNEGIERIQSVFMSLVSVCVRFFEDQPLSPQLWWYQVFGWFYWNSRMFHGLTEYRQVPPAIMWRIYVSNILWLDFESMSLIVFYPTRKKPVLCFWLSDSIQ